MRLRDILLVVALTLFVVYLHFVPCDEAGVVLVQRAEADHNAAHLRKVNRES